MIHAHDTERIDRFIVQAVGKPKTMFRSAVALLAVLGVVFATNKCLNGPCAPGNDYCGQPFKNAPMFHLMDQHGKHYAVQLSFS